MRGGTLIWGHSETVQNLDMHQTGTASTSPVMQNVHASIVTLDANLNVIPNLAESFDVAPDGLTCAFRLRPDVKFHNGKTMTSGDVKYSFDRCRDPATGAVNFEVFNNVAAIETPDDLTVIVRMSAVNAPFLSRLAANGAGVIMPEGSGPQQGTTPIGAGPFRFVSYTPGVVVELERFDDYFGGPAYLDRIIIREISENTTRLTGLQTGELHMINDIPADRVAEIEGNANLQVVKWFPLNWGFVNLNQARFEPFRDRRVRLAFDRAIDKAALLEGAPWGQGQPTASPSYPTSAAYNGVLKPARAGFRASPHVAGRGRSSAWQPQGGVQGDDELPLPHRGRTDPGRMDARDRRRNDDRTAHLGRLAEPVLDRPRLPDVDDELLHAVGKRFPLLQPVEQRGAFNYRSISNPEIDRLTTEARGIVDPAARAEVYKQVQQVIYDEVLDIILWFRNGTIAAQPRVCGLDTVVHPNGSNLNFHKVWLAA